MLLESNNSGLLRYVGAWNVRQQTQKKSSIKVAVMNKECSYEQRIKGMMEDDTTWQVKNLTPPTRTKLQRSLGR